MVEEVAARRCTVVHFSDFTVNGIKEAVESDAGGSEEQKITCGFGGGLGEIEECAGGHGKEEGNRGE